MSLNRKSQSLASLAAALTFVLSGTVTAYGAGFEKSTSWSGHWMGVAGAAGAAVSGSESLFFNPAGLAGKQSDVTLNISPTFSQFRAPIGQPTGTEVYGSVQFSPPYGALASYKVNDKLGIGVGSYISGGSRAKYDDVSTIANGVNGPANQALNDFETDLTLNEVSLGAGYEIMPGLRFGASYRISMVSAKLTKPASLAGLPGGLAALNNTVFGQARFENMKQTKWDGFRAALQYGGTGWGVGASFRSKVSFDLSGDVTLQTTAVAPGNPGLNIAEGTKTGTGSLSSELPEQLAVSGWFDATPTLRTYLEYSLTHYASVKSIGTSGTFDAANNPSTLFGGAAGSTVASGVTSSLNAGLTTAWRNQHVARIGFEYNGMSMPIRFGYALTSQVTPNQNATPTFSSPGTGNDILVGTGYSFTSNLMANAALDYSFASGEGSSPAVVGTYGSHGYVAHLGATYVF